MRLISVYKKQKATNFSLSCLTGKDQQTNTTHNTPAISILSRLKKTKTCFDD